MGVSFDVFYEQFSLKHLDTSYKNLQEDVITKMFRSTLISAISRFRTCYSDKTLDEANDQILEDLTIQEIEITVELMILVWLETKIQDTENFRDVLTTKDYTVFSKANLLSQKENSKENKQKYVDKLIAEYGSMKAIEAIKKINSRKLRYGS